MVDIFPINSNLYIDYVLSAVSVSSIWLAMFVLITVMASISYWWIMNKQD